MVNGKGTHNVVVDDEEVQDRVAIGVLEVGVGALGDEEADALDLVEDGGEGERVLAEVGVALVVGVGGQRGVLVVEVVDAPLLLVVGREELAGAALVHVGALHQQVLHQARVLRHDGHVQRVLAVVVLAHVDVVDHAGEEAEHALGHLHSNKRNMSW